MEGRREEGREGQCTVVGKVGRKDTGGRMDGCKGEWRGREDVRQCRREGIEGETVGVWREVERGMEDEIMDTKREGWRERRWIGWRDSSGREGTEGRFRRWRREVSGVG